MWMGGGALARLARREFKYTGFFSLGLGGRAGEGHTTPFPRTILLSPLHLFPDGLLGFLARRIGVAVAVQVSLVAEDRGPLR